MNKEPGKEKTKQPPIYQKQIAANSELEEMNEI